jgi:hypothetical protein
MSPEQKPQPDFEQRLLARLKAVVAERGAAAAAAEVEGAQPATSSWRRRAPRLALGAGIALAAIAAVLIVSAGGDNTSKAFAVEPQQGGGVKIKIYSLEDASGLEQALEDAGIRAQVTWLPAGKVCREPHYKPTSVHLPGGGSFGGMTMGGPGGITIGISSTKTSRESFGKRMRGEISEDELANVNLDPAAFGPGQSVVLSGTPVPYNGDPEGGSITKMGVAEGPVEPCKLVPALPSGFSAFGDGEGAGPPTIRTATRLCPRLSSPPIYTRPPTPPQPPTPRSKPPRPPGSSSTRRPRCPSWRAGCPKATGRVRRSTPDISSR